MANGFPVGLAGASVAARVGVIAGAALTPAGIAAIIAGAGLGIALTAFAEWWFRPVPNPFSGTWYDADGNPHMPLGRSFGAESDFIAPDMFETGQGFPAFEFIPNAFDEIPFELVELTEIPNKIMPVKGKRYLTDAIAGGWTQCPGGGPGCNNQFGLLGVQHANTAGCIAGSACSVTGNVPSPYLPGNNFAALIFGPAPLGNRYDINYRWIGGFQAVSVLSDPSKTQLMPGIQEAATPNDNVVPLAPGAFGLPIKGAGTVAGTSGIARPGVNRPPVPLPVPGVAPVPVAPVNPAFPGGLTPPFDLPIVVPGVGAIPGIDNPPVVVEIIIPTSPPTGVVVTPIPPGGNPSPPEKGKREVKMRGKAALGIKFLANQLTEFRDFVKALWQALPRERRRCKKRCTLQQMIADLARNVDYMWNNEAWVKEALVQVISNEIKDNFYGSAGKAYRNAANELRKKGLWGDVAGFQTGTGYRPKPKLEETEFDLEKNVRRLVNLIW